jgi:hypothetical protein
MKTLKIKDPIFGYISIDDDDLCTVINSAMFHRLQDIIQTSYQSVYPSATHNRFTHSLGVYHLGKIAVEKLVQDIFAQNLCSIEELKNLKKTFILACLMHDIGHSPFSHTGEKFYFQYKDENSKVPEIWKLLLNELNDDKFIEDSNGENNTKGAEHEIMSAYVSLKNFPSIFSKLDKSFFVRCIIGLKYSDKNDFKNCFIELLNSKTIDVDKLDYLIRDSFVTGFKSITIDYDRLLKSICIINEQDSICLGFEKSALSTLENVILAHDMERKWIQNHPVIKYECYLVSYMISKIQSYYQKKGVDLFSPEVLSDKCVGTGELRLCLLSDSDIISCAKRLYYREDPIIKEFFSRNDRRKALWKSESEYRIFFEQRGVSGEILNELESRINSLENFLTSKFGIPIINQSSLDYLKSELKAIPDFVRKAKSAELNKIIDFLTIIEKYSQENSIPFDYVLVSAKQFNTGFNKDEFKSIKVRFSNNDIKTLESVVYLFSAQRPNDNFFYLFLEKDSKDKVDVSKLTFKIVDYILHEHNK